MIEVSMKKITRKSIFRRIQLYLLLIGSIVMLFMVLNLNDLFTINGNDLNSKLSDFNSETGNFSIKYPNSFSAGDTPRGNHGDLDVVSVITKTFGSANIVISKKTFSDGQIAEVQNWGQNRAQSQDDFQAIEVKSYNTEKYEGVLNEYLSSMKNMWGTQKLHCYDWYYFSEKLKFGYDFSFCSLQPFWGNAKNVFLKMIDSITFD